MLARVVAFAVGCFYGIAAAGGFLYYVHFIGTLY